MQNHPDPYTTPAARVDAIVEPPVPRSLRTLLRVLIAAQIAILPLLMAIPERLPAELQTAREHFDTLFLTAHPFAMIGFIALSYVSLFGLWWEKRWAAWTFLGVAAADFLLALSAGPRIMSDVVGLLDSISDACMGATLVALYVMGTFSPRAPHDPGAALVR